MTRIPLALPALLLAAPAGALTPEELWSAWQARAAGFGVTLAAEAVPGPDGSLTLRGWTLAAPGRPPEPLLPLSPVQEVTLRPAEGGAVAIDLGLPASGVVPLGDGIDLRIEQDGLAVAARDGADGIDYEVAARSLRAVGLVPADSDWDDLAAEVLGLSARFPGQVGADRTVAVSVTAEGLAYVLGASDAVTGQLFGQASRADGPMSLDVSVTLPEGLSLEEMDGEAGFARALDRGFAARLDLRTGEVAQSTSIAGLPLTYEARTVAAPGTASVAVDGSGVALLIEYGGGSVTATSPHLPFPRLDLSYGRIGAEIRVPLGPDVGDFRYRVALEDVVVGEDAWAALDPQGLLPRDPARLILDLGGRMALDVAAMAAAEAAGMPAPAPPIESLEVRELDVAGAGLGATGTGSFTFDDAAGTPVPVGRATVRVAGLDRLLDALVALGVVTVEDAGNARLGLATFFRAGDGPDVRETTVEAREGGAVFVNGRRVR